MADVPQFEINDLAPELAWEELALNPGSILVDVRTLPEWSFVGVPDLSEIGKAVIFAEWRSYPRMEPNPGFFREVESRLDREWPDTALFICRSGTRSREAAAAFAEEALRTGRRTRCINVAEGFEGHLDADSRRGNVDGWKRKGLAWRQS